jgi:uncharacterized coiled-coil protein SlyX
MEALRQQQAAQATTIEQLRADLAALRAAMAAPARRR